ncbi:MAG: response regulator transcription factor [Burkholderiaceae bacterium]|nr:response regulator transcription factor [Burkholderiaceae bacterium]
MNTLRVLLVDDHPVVRQGYRRLLGLEPDLFVCGEAGTADEACRAAAETAPDVVVLDLNLGASSGLEALRRMKLRDPALRVLVFSMYDGPGHVTQALRAGAQAYLTKSTPPEEMVLAIRRLMRGERVLSPDVAQALAMDHIEAESLMSRLTPREFEVLRLTVRGDSVQIVADRLHLSPKTVFNNLSSIRNKLEVHTDFQLLQLAARHGLVELPVSRAA